jgi:hypothetical protein
MPPTALKLKPKNILGYTVHAQRDTAIFLSLALFIFPSPLSVTQLKLGVVLRSP